MKDIEIRGEGKKRLPSKGFLSAVLDYPKKVDCSIPYEINIEEATHVLGNKLYFNTDNIGLGVSLIDIDELADYCDAWLSKNCYILKSKQISLGMWSVEIISTKDKTLLHSKKYTAVCRAEAIICASEWFFKNVYKSIKAG